jgi:hypothetical protein
VDLRAVFPNLSHSVVSAYPKRVDKVIEKEEQHIQRLQIDAISERKQSLVTDMVAKQEKVTELQQGQSHSAQRVEWSGHFIYITFQCRDCGTVDQSAIVDEDTGWVRTTSAAGDWISLVAKAPAPFQKSYRQIRKA